MRLLKIKNIGINTWAKARYAVIK